MGNLWSVTDKDIDKITKSVLDEIINIQNQNNTKNKDCFDLNSIIH